VCCSRRGPVETDMNGSSHPDHENLLHTIDSRLRASARHGGAGSCFDFAHRSAAGASLRGRWQSSYLRERVVTIPVSYLNKTIFMGNAQLQDKRSRGFHPRRCGSPQCDNPPEQVIPHHRLALGRYGGTGTVPSFFVPAFCFSYDCKKEF
jgi:hypothetical protein